MLTLARQLDPIDHRAEVLRVAIGPGSPTTAELNATSEHRPPSGRGRRRATSGHQTLVVQNRSPLDSHLCSLWRMDYGCHISSLPLRSWRRSIMNTGPGPPLGPHQQRAMLRCGPAPRQGVSGNRYPPLSCASRIPVTFTGAERGR
jgi:hypothetical protein